MKYKYSEFNSNVHRLIPSRYPPVGLFDWAETQKEAEEIAALEGLTNDRLLTEYGDIHLVAKDDWVSGAGATPLMAAFTHPGESRFSDGTYGIYYAGDSLATAVAETKYHRERFLSASKEAPPAPPDGRPFRAVPGVTRGSTSSCTGAGERRRGCPRNKSVG